MDESRISDRLLQGFLLGQSGNLLPFGGGKCGLLFGFLALTGRSTGSFVTSSVTPSALMVWLAT